MKKAKTDLLRLLQKSFAEALKKSNYNTQKQDKGRREFLKKAFIGAAALAGSEVFGGAGFLSRFGGLPENVRIGILGGGVAGLHAAYLLKKQKVAAHIYEASNRTGGRMYTATGLLGEGITTELGGEFVDSIHTDILQLADEFKLELIDRDKDKKLEDVFYFGGNKLTSKDLVKALKPYVTAISADIESLPDAVNYHSFGDAEKFDKTSIADYLKQKGMRGWLYDLFDVAFTTEYGLDIDQQSSINMLFLLIPEKAGDGMFGESDERYKIRGGNQRVVDELAKRVDNINIGYEVVKIKSKGKGFKVDFKNGQSLEFDYLICTIPFTKLRQVKLEIDGMPSVKKKCIDELGYGKNAKMFAGFYSRFWRKSKMSGQVFTDQPFQLGWDSSQMQPGSVGGYSFYTGGKFTDQMKDLPVANKVHQYINEMEKIYPGANAEYTGKNGIFYWPDHPFTLGSYACYKTGQWTTIGGAEIEPVGNMLFAGEHCSADFQGYMNGGAETGRRAAEQLLVVLKK